MGDASMGDVMEQDIPDTLKPMMMERAVNVSVTTEILEPVSHTYNSRDGGHTRFVLQPNGVLNAPNCALVYELVNGAAPGAGTDRRLAFPLKTGGLAMLRRLTFKCGGQILSQVNEAGLYSFVKNQFKSQQFKENVLDIRHAGSNAVRTKVLRNPAGRALQAGFTLGNGLVGYHQLYNPAIDQQNEYGSNVINDGAGGIQPNVQHAFPRNKLLRNYDNGGKGPQVVVRLADVFPIFRDNNLPVFGMAQCELECEWTPYVDSSVRYDAIDDAPIIAADPTLAGATTGLDVSFVDKPILQMDYLHYDEAELMKIQNQINNGQLRLNFTEVVLTNGINPETAGPIAEAQSNHILGMAGKEVKRIYVVKNWDLKSARGQTEKNNRQDGVYSHRNPLLWNYKSVDVLNESYNFIINNERIYNVDIKNPAIAYNALSQCENKWAVMSAEFDTLNYNPSVLSVLNNTEGAGTIANNSADAGYTQRYQGGSCKVIGLMLDKYNELGNTPGNGVRIGSAPIEFKYSCEKVADHRANLNLQFFIEHRRSLMITRMGVSVSDN